MGALGMHNYQLSLPMGNVCSYPSTVFEPPENILHLVHLVKEKQRIQRAACCSLYSALVYNPQKVNSEIPKLPPEMGRAIVLQFEDAKPPGPEWMIVKREYTEEIELSLVFRGTDGNDKDTFVWDRLLSSLFITTPISDGDVTYGFGEEKNTPDFQFHIGKGTKKPRAHTGFTLGVRHAKEDIEQSIHHWSSQYPSAKWSICGHSLGGGYAQIAPLIIDGFEELCPDIFTFGCPMVFSKKGGEIPFEDQIFSFIHRNDVVPRLLAGNVERSMEHLGSSHAYDDWADAGLALVAATAAMLANFCPKGSVYYFDSNNVLLYKAHSEMEAEKFLNHLPNSTSESMIADHGWGIYRNHLLKLAEEAMKE